MYSTVVKRGFPPPSQEGWTDRQEKKGSIRQCKKQEEERSLDKGQGYRSNGDLNASSLQQNQALYSPLQRASGI
jgi:hypothetical protein